MSKDKTLCFRIVVGGLSDSRQVRTAHDKIWGEGVGRFP